MKFQQSLKRELFQIRPHGQVKVLKKVSLLSWMLLPHQIRAHGQHRVLKKVSLNVHLYKQVWYQTGFTTVALQF